METNAKSSEATPAQSQESKVRNYAFGNGYDLSKPLKTNDGDSVRVVTLDLTGTGYPIIGEITETNPAGILSRLARFNVYGRIQAKTLEARNKHSLAKNVDSVRDKMVYSILTSLFGGEGVNRIAASWPFVPTAPAESYIETLKRQREMNTVGFRRFRPHEDVARYGIKVNAPLELMPLEPVQDEPAPAPIKTQTEIDLIALRNEFAALQDHVVKSVGTRLMELRDDVDQNTMYLRGHSAKLGEHCTDISLLNKSVDSLVCGVDNLDKRVARTGR